MVDNERRLLAYAPGQDVDDAICRSRHRINWSATHMIATDETKARALEALKESYRRLGKSCPNEAGLPDPTKDD